MNPHRRPWTLAAAAILLGATAALSLPAPRQPVPDASSRMLMVDEFEGKFALDWQPVRPDESHVSLKKADGKLAITTQRGSIHGDETKDGFGGGIQAKNIYVVANPLAAGADFALTTCVSGFAPAATFHQAGLIVYDDDDNYLKWAFEYNWPKNAGQRLMLVREAGGKPDHTEADAPEDPKKVWLRLTKRGGSYEYASSPNGTDFTVHGTKEWGGRAKKFGLIAKNGGNKDAPEIDALFEFFEARSPVPPAK